MNAINSWIKRNPFWVIVICIALIIPLVGLVSVRTNSFNNPEDLFSRKKDYSDRYSTDCHAGLVEPRVAHANIGVQDFPTYTSIKPTPELLDQIHSFFITAARKMFK